MPWAEDIEPVGEGAVLEDGQWNIDYAGVSAEAISQSVEYGFPDNPFYTPEQFNTLVKEFIGQEEKILDWKRGEYAAGEDRLQNFREVAEFLGSTPAEVALCYLMKHIQSIGVAVKTGNYVFAWEKEGGEGLKQRISDSRNYLLLLAACLEEKEGTNERG